MIPPANRWNSYIRDVDQKKLFWLVVAALGIMADMALPMLWSLVAVLPIFVVSWWIVYRSDWF